jgi:hypothetical protein
MLEPPIVGAVFLFVPPVMLVPTLRARAPCQGSVPRLRAKAHCKPFAFYLTEQTENTHTHTHTHTYDLNTKERKQTKVRKRDLFWGLRATAPCQWLRAKAHCKPIAFYLTEQTENTRTYYLNTKERKQTKVRKRDLFWGATLAVLREVFWGATLAVLREVAFRVSPVWHLTQNNQ